MSSGFSSYTPSFSTPLSSVALFSLPTVNLIAPIFCISVYISTFIILIFADCLVTVCICRSWRKALRFTPWLARRSIQCTPLYILCVTASLRQRKLRLHRKWRSVDLDFWNYFELEFMKIECSSSYSCGCWDRNVLGC